MRLEYTEEQERRLRITEIEGILENHLCEDDEAEKLIQELAELEGSNSMKSTTMFFDCNIDRNTVIVTENADGDLYLIQSNVKDILNDWNGDCDFVPANDARVFFASWYGKPISPYEYTDFESLLKHLQYLQIYG